MNNNLFPHCYFTFTLLLLCHTISPAVVHAENPRVESLDRLVTFLIGSYSSEEQAKADTDYYDIRLRMVCIWKQRTDGHWLYVEQALASKQDHPYRQRVYRLARLTDSTFESAVYTLPDPTRFAGHWKNENPLSLLTLDSLTKRDGCSIILMQEGEDFFEGSTLGTGCPSELRGAAYATSEVKLWKDKLVSWDRGFDKEGKQVWGAEKGGYVFKKLNE